MVAAPIYWLDTNVLITAKNEAFRFTVNPAFWAHLHTQAKAGRVRVPKMVYDEIVTNGNDDDLAKWIKARKADGFCIPASKTVQNAMTKVSDHVIGAYPLHHAHEFLRVADPWIIAHALDGKGAVVTFEARKPGRVRIPVVCKALGVPAMSLYDMLENLEIKFN